MLVSHRFKFIYTKTLKTGGSSVESYFERFCMPEGAWSQSEGRDEYESETGIIGCRAGTIPEGCRWWNHMPASQIREQVGEAIWNDYFKWCVVRNPFDKAVSSFFFFRNVQQDPVDMSDPARARVDFERWLRNMDSRVIDGDKYLIDGQICLDMCVRYENLEADLAKVCHRVGVPWVPTDLPGFKRGVRPSSAKAEALYNEASRKIVEEAYARELTLFGYRFPGE